MFTQEEIGKEFGLTVPKSYKELLPGAGTGKMPPAGWGTQVNKKEYSINKFFLKYNLPLKEVYYPLLKIKNII